MKSMHGLRYALRTLARSPGLTAVIILSLALGIGANTAIFSVVSALLLRPLPYPDPDRLAVLWLRSPGINIPQDWPSPGQYIDLQNENGSFEEMSISIGASGSMAGVDQPEQIEGIQTSSSLFHLLGAKPLLGRMLLAEDDKTGGPPVVVLSYALWTRLFHSDPNIVGRSVTLNGFQLRGGANNNQFNVVGVLSPDFLLNREIMPTVSSTERMDLFLPLRLGANAVNNRGDENYNLMARLKPGVSMSHAQADVAAIAARIREKDKRDRTFTISVVPLLDQVVGNVRRAVLVLMGSVALVLLIACANVANLLLARASVRQKEVAIRTALGAGWYRLMVQLLTESVLLALAGGAAGLLIARIGLYLVRAFNPGNIPRLYDIAVDARVLVFTFGVSILTGIIFGIAPALRAARVDLNVTLKAGGRSTQSDSGFRSTRHPLRSLLVITELAFSLMLLIGSGLLVRSFVRLQNVSPGFNPDHVVSMRLGPGARRFQKPDEAVEYIRQLGQRIASVPGVELQGEVSSLPFTTSVGWGKIDVEGFQPQPGQELQVDMRNASSDYFRTMGIPLIMGRFFSEHDGRQAAAQVALIDEKFARRFWPNGDALGKHVGFGPKNQLTIVGVVGSVKQYGLDIEDRIVVYFPFGGQRWVVVRTSAEPASAANAVVREIHSFDSTVPVYDIRTMRQRMSDSLARQRFSAMMLSAFSLFAFILAAVGVYGVMSYLITQGTHDIGVRIALGARRGSILRLVVAQGMELAAIGIAAGLLGALALTRVMSSLLFGVSATDLGTFSSVALILAFMALLASFVPARRATRIDPLVALRDE